MTYAKTTEVPADRSKAEIERTLARYGATRFLYGWDDQQNVALVSFTVQGRDVRLIIPMPDANDPAYRVTENGRRRTSQSTVIAAYEQAVRQRWRAVALIIKAKLEAIEAGISTIEREFLADIMLPNGSTAGEWLQPQIAAIYESGQMPATLPGLPSPAHLLLLEAGT
jgi:hypothetical protein